MGDRLRLLWVTPYLPRRGFSAAREYWWSLLLRLGRRHDITLLAFADPGDLEADAQLVETLTAVHVVAKTPWRPDDPFALLPRTVAGGFSNPAFADAIADRLAADRYDLAQYEFIEMAHLMPPATIPTILTVHQLASAGEYPMWRQQGGGLQRGVVALHRYLRELDFELRGVRRADQLITVSRHDAARLRRFQPGLRISVSPVGVDCAYFRPRTEAPTDAAIDPAAGLDTDLLFVGNFEHPPNPDAVAFLVRDVLPQIDRPVRVRIVGRGVTPEVEALGRPGAGAAVEIVGGVADVRLELARTRVVVAPVRFGTGMRGKVLEALAMGRPVVTTSLGAEGLGARREEHLLIADDATSFAAAIMRVLDDDGFARTLGSAGRRLIETRFDWDAIAAGHETIYERLLQHANRVPPPRVFRTPTRQEAIVRRGRWPAIALGAILLAARAVRWHVPRLWQPAVAESRLPLSPLGENSST